MVTPNAGNSILAVPEWPFSLGPPTATGLVRICPDDFIVEEIARINPEGKGDHLWFWVEKRSANTDWVAGQLARLVNCAHRDVGFAGMKDRHAVTRQWFSVPAIAGFEIPVDAGIEGVRILESHRHTRKLKRGTLDGNRFQLKIREFNGDLEQTIERLEQIRLNGVPNYFGPQRFGIEGKNVQQGFDLLSSNARMKRNKRSIYLSSLRSFLFNHVLAERVRHGSWDKMMDGDLAMLDGTQSIFPCKLPDADIEDRCKCLDIHPTGPMPGAGGAQPVGDAAQLELQIFEYWPELIKMLNAQGVKASRRALRLYPSDLEWEFEGTDMTLTFVLPPGAYATTVLREILLFNEAKQLMNRGS